MFLTGSTMLEPSRSKHHISFLTRSEDMTWSRTLTRSGLEADWL
jgi:hypothetical protein